MANLSTTLFSSITTASLPSPLPCASDKAKGCGYNGQTDAVHTVQFTVVNGFVGTIKIQGTLATTPVEADWYEIDNTEFGNGTTPVADGAFTTTFSGNHVWVRAVITAFTAGDINRVLFSHN